MLLLRASFCPKVLQGPKWGVFCETIAFVKQEKGKGLKTERNFWDTKVLWFFPEDLIWRLWECSLGYRCCNATWVLLFVLVSTRRPENKRQKYRYQQHAKELQNNQFLKHFAPQTFLYSMQTQKEVFGIFEKRQNIVHYFLNCLDHLICEPRICLMVCSPF